MHLRNGLKCDKQEQSCHDWPELSIWLVEKVLLDQLQNVVEQKLRCSRFLSILDSVNVFRIYKEHSFRLRM